MATNKDLPKEERARAYSMPTAVFNNDYAQDGTPKEPTETPWFGWVHGRELGSFGTFTEAIHSVDWWARHPNALGYESPDYSPNSPHWGQHHEDCCK